MKSEDIIILNNKGQKLIGKYYQNTSGTLMIFCHGTESFSQHVDTINPFLKEYFSLGFSLLLFDFTGYGKSEGKGKFNHSQRVADIGSVLNHFKFKGKYKNIILCGISLGCAAAAIAAIKYGEVTKLCLINGYYYLRLTYPKFYFQTVLGYLFNNEIRMQSLYFWRNLQVKKIRVPTLVVAGARDIIINPKNSINFYNKLICKKKLIIVPDGDHALLDKKYYAEFFPEVIRWLKEK